MMMLRIYTLNDSEEGIALCNRSGNMMFTI